MKKLIALIILATGITVACNSPEGTQNTTNSDTTASTNPTADSLKTTTDSIPNR